MDYKKILVLQTAFLGDAILSTPMLKGLREIFKDSQIDILCLPQTKQVFENNPHISNILTFDKRSNKLISFIKTVSDIKKRNYDLGISIQSSMTSSLLMKLGNIKIKHGFSRQKMLDTSVNHSNFKGLHKIEKILKLLEQFSDKKFDMQTELFISNDDYDFVNKNISNLDKSKKIIAIAPGSVWETKKWPSLYYKSLISKLNDYNIFLIGGKEDYDLCQYIKDTTDAYNFAGKFSINQSAAVIEKSDLILTNDSAPLHLANAVKTDVIAIFGPTVKELGFYPYRENDQILEINLACRPCGNHGGKKCPQKHFKCMKELDVDMVLTRIKSMLNFA